MANDHYVPQFYLKDFSPMRDPGQIYVYRWHLLESTTSRVFVTSDNPVVLTRREAEALWSSIGLRRGSVLLTLSPTRCLLIDDAKHSNGVLGISRETADAINNYIIAHAHSAVFASLQSKTMAAAFDRTVFGKNTDLPRPTKLD